MIMTFEDYASFAPRGDKILRASPGSWAYEGPTRFWGRVVLILVVSSAHGFCDAARRENDYGNEPNLGLLGAAERDELPWSLRLTRRR